MADFCGLIKVQEMITKVLIVVYLISTFVLPINCQLHDQSFPAHPSDAENGRRLTKEYRLKQGSLKGLVLEPRDGRSVGGVEVFLGIPYAEAPVGGLRFMPPGSAIHWSGMKLATQFAPVCPQMLPDLKKEVSISAGRYNYMKRLLPFLKNQSEDCLYLNVYVPSTENYPSYSSSVKKFPVMIFIHGESFEWNSGNPYDGTVLAAYGQIIVVTINFRLGILGFMKPSISEHTIGNFGLLDQIAALQWVKDNIAVFNGDPNAVTLAGHGTGAACANFLMVSPVANGLFHRAILMSGSALSDWSLTSNPLQFTVQAAQSLNCPLTADDLGECLRKKRLSEIMAIRVSAPKYMTPFGPIIDGSVIPNEPAQVMGVYKDLFSKYELLYGCTELESYHLLGAVALAHGMLEGERDALLRQYTRARFEYRPDLALAATLKEYSSFEMESASRSAADTNRDTILDILSDARVTAPIVQTANFHSKANPKSFFYVFGHNSQAGEYAAISKSVHGEELAYMFGVPLGATKNHFREEYSPQEKLFSEIMMTYWTNFARTGNPNTPRKRSFTTLGPKEWDKYDIEWPKYSQLNQSFIHLGIPPFVSSQYRGKYMRYWNEALPRMLKNHTDPFLEFGNPAPPVNRYSKTTQKPFQYYGAPPAWANPAIPKPNVYPEPKIVTNSGESEKYGHFNTFVRQPSFVKPAQENPYDAIRKMEKPVRPMVPGLMDGPLRKIWKTSKPPILVQTTEATLPTLGGTKEDAIQKSGLTLYLFIGIGVSFLIFNIFAFAFLYHKKTRLKSREREIKRLNLCTNGDVPDGDINMYEKAIVQENNEDNDKGCNVFSVMKKSKGNDDFYEPVKNVYDGSKTPKSDDSGGFGQRFKLRRHMSNSTLDAHTKVKDWIAHEIVQRCSPRFLRKNEEIKEECKNAPNGILISLPNCGDNLNKIIEIPRPNCQIGSLTGSLRATTNSTASVGAHEKQLKLIESMKKGHDKKKSKPGSKGSKPSNHSVSTKSNKSKRSCEKNDSTGSLRKEKPQKVSVAVDATPATRSSSVLKQQPIELSKSLDYCCYDDNVIQRCSSPLRRSQTVEDFIKRSSKESLTEPKENVFKSSVNLQVSVEKPSEIVKIVHKHSRSDPVKDINYAEMFPRGLPNKPPGSFNSFNTIQPPVAFRNDINVTSREEMKGKVAMTPAEALMTIKRRNYPKVLPDFPKPGEFMPNMTQKRLSLPPQSHLLLLPTSEESSLCNSETSSPTEMKSFSRCPPLPPPRISSTLGRKPPYQDGMHGLDRINSFERSKTLGHYNYSNMPPCVDMYPNGLPNPAGFLANQGEMPYYSQVKPKNKINMMQLENSDLSLSECTSESEKEEERTSPSPYYEAIKPKAKVIISAKNKGEASKLNDNRVIIKPVINKKPNTRGPTNIPRVLARDNSFEADDRKSKPYTSSPIAVNQKAGIFYDTIDSKLMNYVRPTDIKIEIPVYKPDTKGPPTTEEILKSRSSSEINVDGGSKTNSLQRQPSKPIATEKNDDNLKQEAKITKVEPKSASVSRSGSASKIPKTPIMSSKTAKKEPAKVQSNQKSASKGKSVSSKKVAPKGSAIPQPVPGQKITNALSDKDLSASESSNDTESSTGTVKKVK